MKQRIFEVRPEQAAWVVRDNIGLYATRHRTREEAVEQGHKIAEASKPCRLIVQNAEGAIAYDLSFGVEGPPTINLD